MAAGGSKTDYYELLGVSEDVSFEDLKKAYRRAALRYHPDKNPDRVEEATAIFKNITEAYTTLSDPRERAFYDEHKEDILRGASVGGGDDEDGQDANLSNLWMYFSSSCYDTMEGDGENSFFAVYGRVFDGIRSEEARYTPRESREDASALESRLPKFGSSTMDENSVRSWYLQWRNYTSKMSFAWSDRWDARNGADRWARRAMEKENKKCRTKARKKRVELVRRLVEHVQRRDPRWAKAEENARVRDEERKRLREAQSAENAAQLEKEQAEKLAKLEQEAEAYRVSMEKMKGFRLDDEEDFEEEDEEEEEEEEENTPEKYAEGGEEKEEEYEAPKLVGAKREEVRLLAQTLLSDGLTVDEIEVALEEMGYGDVDVEDLLELEAKEVGGEVDDYGGIDDPVVRKMLGKKKKKGQKRKGVAPPKPIQEKASVCKICGEIVDEEEHSCPICKDCGKTLNIGHECAKDDDDDIKDLCTCSECRETFLTPDELQLHISKTKHTLSSSSAASAPSAKKSKKKGKRRAAKATQAATEERPEMPVQRTMEASGAATSNVCLVCGAYFPSKTKLMAHLRKTGHTALKTDVEAAKQSVSIFSPGDAVTAARKSKKGRRRKHQEDDE